jgi:hypothetical protein
MVTRGRKQIAELYKSKISLRCWSHTWQKKKQEEAKHQHPKHPTLTKLLDVTLH